MSPWLLLLSPPVLIAVILAIEWALTRKSTYPAELLESDVSE